MELSENLKLRLENLNGENQGERSTRSTDPASGGDTGPIDEAESQMRRALGLLGEGQRHRPDAERAEQPHRVGDRFNGGLHRRRFVQDGDIPVTVLRRDQGHDQPAYRGTPQPTPPTSSRLQRTEAALAAETAAREKAERSLADMQALAHDLQTKIGHAELAKNEAIEALHREREVTAQLRAEAHTWQDRLDDALAQSRTAEQGALSWQDQLADERHARKSTEKALRMAEAAREEAERLVHALSEESPAPRPTEPPRRPHIEPEVVAAASRRPRVAEMPATEPEPVKWWLNTKPTAKRR
jgi:uncharacterized protein (DUF4415 family)